MGRATEYQELWMCRFSKGRWLIARDEVCDNGQRYFNVYELVNVMITNDVQVLMVVKFDQELKLDQEALSTDVKSILAGEMRDVGRQGKSCGESSSVERSNNVSKESSISASKTANALTEKSLREMQSTENIEEVMLMKIEKPRHQPCSKTITFNLRDRCDEVVAHATDRVVKARIVHFVPRQQRQQTKAETAGGEMQARVSDFWSSKFRWDVQLAGSQPRDRRKMFTHTRDVKDVAVRNCERSQYGECSSDRKDHGTDRRQSLLALYQAGSGTLKVWFLQGLCGMSCGSLGRRGVETSWQGVPESASEWL